MLMSTSSFYISYFFFSERYVWVTSEALNEKIPGQLISFVCNSFGKAILLLSGVPFPAQFDLPSNWSEKGKDLLYEIVGVPQGQDPRTSDFDSIPPEEPVEW